VNSRSCDVKVNYRHEVFHQVDELTTLLTALFRLRSIEGERQFGEGYRGDTEVVLKWKISQGLTATFHLDEDIRID
jgi:hypothetical protein